jgi:uncharacterized protein (TIGR02246 family)
MAMLSSVACKAPPSELSEADVAAIRAQINTYVSTALAGDWEAWGRLLAPDYVQMSPGQPPVVGREAVLALARTWPRLTSFTVTIDEIAGQGDLAYARGTYQEAGTLPDGSAMSDRGKWLQIHRRQADGTWLYTRLLYHSDVPAPAPQPRQ